MFVVKYFVIINISLKIVIWSIEDFKNVIFIN